MEGPFDVGGILLALASCSLCRRLGVGWVAVVLQGPFFGWIHGFLGKHLLSKYPAVPFPKMP